MNGLGSVINSIIVDNRPWSTYSYLHLNISWKKALVNGHVGGAVKTFKSVNSEMSGVRKILFTILIGGLLLNLVLDSLFLFENSSKRTVLNFCMNRSSMLQAAMTQEEESSLIQQIIIVLIISCNLLEMAMYIFVFIDLFIHNNRKVRSILSNEVRLDS